MDKRIEKKKWSRTKIMYLIGFMAFILLSGFGINMFNKKTYKVDGSRLSVKTVTEGDFQDVILIDGDVQPINLVLVNTMEGGTVEEIFVEDGVLVEKGDPLVKLNNPAATLSYMNQETAIVEQINNLRSLKLSLEKADKLLINENKIILVILNIPVAAKPHIACVTGSSLVSGTGVSRFHWCIVIPAALCRFLRTSCRSHCLMSKTTSQLGLVSLHLRQSTTGLTRAVQNVMVRDAEKPIPCRNGLVHAGISCAIQHQTCLMPHSPKNH